MTFMVRPVALREAASQLQEDSEQAKKAKDYVAEQGTLNWHDAGLINEMTRAHTNFVAHLDRQLTHLVDLLAASGAELLTTANYYEHTDQKSAAAMDATLPPVPHPDREPH